MAIVAGQGTRRLRWRWVLVVASGVALASAAVFLVSGGLAARSGLTSPADVVNVTVAVGSLAISVFALWQEHRERARQPIDGAEIGLAASYLAELVRRQWTDEAAARQLRHPEPIRVRWSSTGRAGVAAAPHLVVGGMIAGRPTRLKLHGDVAHMVELVRDLPARQLVILGAPGAGKTVLAILFTLAELRRIGPRDPVPVLFTISNWDPSLESLQDWLIHRIAEEYPALSHTGRYGPQAPTELVCSGRILPILDGLDELPEPALPAALDALNHAAAAGPGLIVTCRSHEFEQMALAREKVLARSAVVEIEPVPAADAIDYLVGAGAQGHGRMTAIVEELRSHPDGSFAVAVATPFMIGLLRSVYADPETDPTELLDQSRFPDTASIEQHLLARYLPTAYATRQPTRNTADPRGGYRVERSRAWLTFLLRHLARHTAGATDIAWWELSRVLPARLIGALVGVPAAAMAGLTVGIILVISAPTYPEEVSFTATAAALIVGLTVARNTARLAATVQPSARRASGLESLAGAAIRDGATVALAMGLYLYLQYFQHDYPVSLQYFQHDYRVSLDLALWSGLLAASASALANGVAAGQPGLPHLTSVKLRTLPGHLARGFGTGLLVGAPIGLPSGLIAGAADVRSPVSTAITVAALLTGGLMLGIGLPLGLGRWLQTPFDEHRATTPLSVLRADRTATLAIGLAICLPLGLGVGILTLYDVNIPIELTTTIAIIVASIAVLGSGRAWLVYTAVRVGLATNGRLPWRLMRFLDFSYDRGVLRRTGATYQMRHARLQAYLLQQTDSRRAATMGIQTPRRPNPQRRWLRPAATAVAFLMLLANAALVVTPGLSQVRGHVAEELRLRSLDDTEDPLLSLRLQIAAYALDRDADYTSGQLREWAAACQRANGQGLTKEQWNQFLGAFRIIYPYRETCPPTHT